MRARRRVFRLGVTAAFLATAACSAIAGLDGDFEPFTDGGASSGTDGTSGGPTDGQTPSKDGQTTEDGSQTPLDSSTPDHNEPVDACTTRTLAVPDASGDPEAGPCPDGVTFCYNFNAGADASPYGWGSELKATGGAVAILGVAPQAERRLHATIGSGAGSDASAGLLFVDWDGVGAIDPILVDNGEGLALAFSLRIIDAKRQGDVVRFQVGGRGYGLTLYPDPCNGNPRVAQSDEDPANPMLGVTVALNQWYRGEIRYKRSDDNKWSGEVRVGGVLVGTRNDIFAANLPQALTAALGAGLMMVGPPGTSSVVEIDDMFITRFQVP